MRKRILQSLALVLILLAIPASTGAAPNASLPLETAPEQSAAALDYDLPSGHFYTQTNGSPLGTSATGFAITNEDGVLFWEFYQRLGGPYVLGYPVTGRFMYDGFVTQAMQKAVFQWRPEVKQVYFLNTFDAMHDRGLDEWLLVYRQTPKPFEVTADIGLSWDQVVRRHLTFLDQNQAIKTTFMANPYWMDHYGLPQSYADAGNAFVIRAQRATFQYWKEDVPWAKTGEVTIANGGDLAKEAGLWGKDAIVPIQPPSQQATTGVTPTPLPAAPSGTPVPAAAPTAAPTAVPTTAPTVVPTATPVQSIQTPAGVYRAASPEYGMNIFIMGAPSTTNRDLDKVRSAGFAWQKTLFQWREIEGAGKGQFNWTESDRVVAASNNAGVKIIARLDFEPYWARADRAHNGPPDNYNDFADFVYALVNRYKTGSSLGRIPAIEIWNEPNLAREWGNQQPNAADYVRLLKVGYEAAKRADPNVTVITAGLTPTGTWNAEATPDDIYLQQMYDNGAKAYFDVLGAHGAGYKAPPEMAPEAIAADPSYGGHRFFGFRRVEDLRNVMVRNGDSSKQIWLLEFGWTSDTIHPAYAWHAVSEDQKADYIVRAYKYAQTNWSGWIGVMTLWNLPAPDWNNDREEYWWSIANADGSDRPAYTRLRDARASGYLP